MWLFSPVNLSHINLILDQPQEPRRRKENFFLPNRWPQCEANLTSGMLLTLGHVLGLLTSPSRRSTSYHGSLLDLCLLGPLGVRAVISRPARRTLKGRGKFLPP